MDIKNLKTIFKDKLKAAYIISFTVLLILGYLLIVRIDLGGFYKLTDTLGESRGNLTILQTIAKYKTYINDFNKKLALKGIGADWLVGTITDSAKKKFITLDLVRPVDTGSVSGYEKISVMVQGRASYHNINEFVSELENNKKFLVVEDFKLETRKGLLYSSSRRSYIKNVVSPLRDDLVGEEDDIESQAGNIAIFELVVTGFKTGKEIIVATIPALPGKIPPEPKKDGRK